MLPETLKRRRCALMIVIVLLYIAVVRNAEPIEWESLSEDRRHYERKRQQHRNLKGREEQKLSNSSLFSAASPSVHGEQDLQPNRETADVIYTSYHPVTTSVIARFYAHTRANDSLAMMSPPNYYQGLTCAELQLRHQREYNAVVRRINLTEGPRFGVYGFFYNPYSLCGRYLLSHLTGGRHLHVFALRVRSTVDTPPLNTPVALKAGHWSDQIVIEECGQCLNMTGGLNGDDSCAIDVLFIARLLNENRVLHAEVVPGDGVQQRGGNVVRVIRLNVPEPGDYFLEVKMVHVDGSSDDFRVPKTLGFVGTRATVEGRKAFLYGEVCDIQRNVYGSPMRIRVLPADTTPGGNMPPFCNISSNYNTNEGGRWVRFIDGAEPNTLEGAPHPLVANCTSSDRYCSGNPVSLTDACGHSNHLVWVPSSCRLRVFPLRSGGPSTVCMRTSPLGTRTAFMLFVGDSIVGEYKSNCNMMRFGSKGSQMACVYANIPLEAKYFSKEYAVSVVRVILDNIEQTKPLGVLVTNLGIQHLIGKGTASQWVSFLDTFVCEWRRRNITVLRGPYTAMPPFGAPAAPTAEEIRKGEWRRYMLDQNARSRTIMDYTGKGPARQLFPTYMEWAVWLSPPAVHYARDGMTQQREMLWDRLAYERLQRIGFIRIDTMTPSLSRQEGSWDGLHQLSQYGKVQSQWRNRRAVLNKYNGGVSLMLFLILINVVCFS